MNEKEHVFTVEEQCSRTIVKRKKVEADRSSNNQPPLAIEEGRKHLSITIHEEITNSLKHKLKKVMEAEVKISRTTGENTKPNTTTSENPKPKIQKVPTMLRVDQNNYKKYYEPRLVPIGPIHHENKQLELAETYKHRLAATFIGKSDREGEFLYKKIEGKIKELRDCYDNGVTDNYDDEYLAWMLFLDGCFLLQFIDSLVNSDLKKLNFKIDQMAFAQQDLLLLENQLPFQVLKLLMNACSSDRKEDLKTSINKFIKRNVAVEENKNVTLEDMEKNEPAHLLDLLQLTLLKFIKPRDRPNSTNNTYRKTFRNVQDLRNAGIQLWQGKVDFRKSCFTGYLYLPGLVVDDSTGSKFLNLAAYEMCPDNQQTEYEITSYICFLDSLIDHPEDVKELRLANILHNCLGSDKEVAKLFNEISTGLVPDPDMYDPVIVKIENHYNKKWMTWMNQVYHDHFSSPWTIVAFLAAVLVLALTGLQTWYTVKPSPGK